MANDFRQQEALWSPKNNPAPEILSLELRIIGEIKIDIGVPCFP
jgi:hypothetical protein